ncbi:hypothetical protein [Nannocystis pusilla]|uniref:Uncharacterized protein n=1 Tax=Nannocystis pusilla TaxID=889268 RepID=A0ABS7TVP6_9BACT|nr:hypothetical protein [Nannocystis pusilla]MBZ5712249.1 hypothetical protein [Nannocystis pusilla]
MTVPPADLMNYLRVVSETPIRAVLWGGIMNIEWQQGSDTIQLEGRTHKLPGPAEQVLEWPGRPLIAVLLASGVEPQRLLLLGPDGQIRGRLGPPAGFELYYLELDPHRGVTAVCTTDTPINGWSDWRFAVSPEIHTLQRFSPSK